MLKQQLRSDDMPFFRFGKDSMVLGKQTKIMGILNVTPDSF
ncbi:MAG TPA: dihydropteroate synthase, partial [Ruminococcaceae bacterium]|nr:dihydropteroate synthase [Oscillospiraceae bacterium]